MNRRGFLGRIAAAVGVLAALPVVKAPVAEATQYAWADPVRTYREVSPLDVSGSVNLSGALNVSDPMADYEKIRQWNAEVERGYATFDEVMSTSFRPPAPGSITVSLGEMTPLEPLILGSMGRADIYRVGTAERNAAGCYSVTGWWMGKGPGLALDSMGGYSFEELREISRSWAGRA